MLEQAEMKNRIDNRRRQSAKPEPGREWTKLDESIYQANEILIAHRQDIHAVYEARERKRNAQLGLPPTLAELVDLLRDQPPTNANLDANSPSLTQAEIKAKTITK
jgi:predicted  nucleic acid-binding Zn-ribbon protein